MKKVLLNVFSGVFSITIVIAEIFEKMSQMKLSVLVLGNLNQSGFCSNRLDIGTKLI